MPTSAINLASFHNTFLFHLKQILKMAFCGQDLILLKYLLKWPYILLVRNISWWWSFIIDIISSEIAIILLYRVLICRYFYCLVMIIWFSLSRAYLVVKLVRTLLIFDSGLLYCNVAKALSCTHLSMYWHKYYRHFSLNLLYSSAFNLWRQASHVNIFAANQLLRAILSHALMAAVLLTPCQSTSPSHVINWNIRSECAFRRY